MERVAGIYILRNLINNKVYVGKSSDIKRRLASYKCNLKKEERPTKQINSYLFNAVKKYGLKNFQLEIIENFKDYDDRYASERELYWMDYYRSYETIYGYNLRRDSSTKMIVHDSTKLLLSNKYKGENNPNYNNKWTIEQKNKMSLQVKERHKSGLYYTENWKTKQGINSKRFWESNPNIKKQMALNVKATKQEKYRFIQIDRYTKEVIKIWNSVEDIINENPTYKWQQIYSVCSGHKPTIYGFIWRKELKI